MKDHAKAITQKLIGLVKKPILLLLPLSLFFTGWWMALPPQSNKPSDDTATAEQQQWTCSMHPQIRQPNSGLCPICNMDLILLEAGNDDGGLREVSISDEAAALLDLRVSPVLHAPAEIDIKLFGKIDYDERSIVTTTARMTGRLDRLFADFTGTLVSEGDAIGEIYSPELILAQHTLINARIDWQNARSASEKKRNLRMLESAREKMRLLNLSDQQIATIEQLDKPKNHITLLAPQSGVIVNLNAKEGQYLNTGDSLFGIANLKSVWLKMEAYESDLPWLRYAQDVAFTVEAIPGKTFHGRIAFIDPQLDPQRRIVKVRVNVDNQDGLLKPGMFANASAKAKIAINGQVIDADLAGKWISPMHPEIVKDSAGPCDICGMPLVPAEKLGFVAPNTPVKNPLLIPASAVLRTGDRAVVYVRIPKKNRPTFEGREIVLGPRTDKHFIVANGLDEGELVVTTGAYKLDSELQIKARPSMMNPNAGIVEAPAKSGPKQIAAQWPPVLRAYDRLKTAIQQNDPAQAKISLASMRHALEQIQTSRLQAKDLALWNEFSMRLSNTLASIKQPSHADLITIRLELHETGRYIGLPWQAIATPGGEQKWIKPLKKTIDAYLVIAKSLSDDQPSLAHESTPELNLAASSLPAGDEKTKLLQAISGLQKVKEIKPMRAAFKPVSDILITLIRQHGIDQLGSLYIVHCPMALKNTGADWLSPDPQVRNPYFGDAMYDCGDVTDTLSLQSPITSNKEIR